MVSKKEITLLKSLFAVDENGDYFLRIVEDKPKGKLSNGTNSQSNLSLEVLLRKTIVKDKNGQNAIRLAPVKYGMSMKEAEAERLKQNQDAINKANKAFEADEPEKAAEETEAKPEKATKE